MGNCSSCGKAIYCLDGFFNGVILEDSMIVCFDCDESEQGFKIGP